MRQATAKLPRGGAASVNSLNLVRVVGADIKYSLGDGVTRQTLDPL